MSILTDKEIEFIRKEAKDLNLALPTKAEELRKILRRLFKKYHPDGKGTGYSHWHHRPDRLRCRRFQKPGDWPRPSAVPDGY